MTEQEKKEHQTVVLAGLQNPLSPGGRGLG